MQTADATPKCIYCGALPHQGVCPTMKAIEYHENGTVKRVEFKAAADYQLPFPQPNWNDPKLTAAAAPDLTFRTYTIGGKPVG